MATSFDPKIVTKLVAIPPSQNKSIPTGCSFCGSVETEAPMTVKMFRIVSRKNKFVGFGVQCKTSYETISIDLPRCDSCKQSHDRLGLVVQIPAAIMAIGLLVFGIWVLFSSYNIDIKMVFGLVVSFAMLGFMGLIVIGFIFKIVEFTADCLGFNTELRAQQVEPIVSLLTAGWQIGDKPPYKGEDIDE